VTQGFDTSAWWNQIDSGWNDLDKYAERLTKGFETTQADLLGLCLEKKNEKE
jgi:hypothetical protein